MLKWWLGHLVGALALGCCIYLIGRDIDRLLVGAVFPDEVGVLRIAIPGWIAFQLVDGLWMYAGLSALAMIWGEELLSRGRLWIAGFISLALLSEYFQEMHWIPGTGDLWDVMSYVLATLVFLGVYALCIRDNVLKKDSSRTS